MIPYAVKWRRFVSGALAAAALCAAGPAAQAAQANTPKEEVAYASLNADGSVRQIHVVNIFDLEQDGTVTDYGRYASVRNMTATDPIRLEGDTVSVQAEAGRLYYEGEMEDGELPWDVSVDYELDGQSCDAGEVAGKSGALRIRLRIAENTACPGSFFDDYALQVSLALDTARCGSITSTDATVANVGGDKQLSYLVLPGMGLDTEITADVTDFAMDGISINGVALRLGAAVNSAGLAERAGALTDAVVSLDERMQSLKSGADGVQTALDGLDEQAAALREDLAALGETLNQLQTALAAAAGTSEDLSALSDAVDALAERYGELDGGVTAYTDSVAQIGADYRPVASGVARLATGSGLLRAGAESLANGAGLPQGIQGLYGGSGPLQEGLGKLAAAALNEQTGGISGLIQGAVDGLLGAVSGDGQTAASFASDKNTNVRSMQFVLKTDPIAAPEPPAPTPAPTESAGFWDRLTALFGD